MTSTHDSEGTPRRRPHRALLVLGLGLLALAVLALLLWQELMPGPAVYVVGDSITYLSQTAIADALSRAGYTPTISATPGVKIEQSLANITRLAQNRPRAWIVELGTNDAGANNTMWRQPFQEVWKSVSPASCVIYVTVSPRAGPIATEINAAIEDLARSHGNVHVLDWGRLEYSTPGLVEPDTIHPTPQGQVALANLEAQELKRSCGS